MTPLLLKKNYFIFFEGFFYFFDPKFFVKHTNSHAICDVGCVMRDMRGPKNFFFLYDVVSMSQWDTHFFVILMLFSGFLESNLSGSHMYAITWKASYVFLQKRWILIINFAIYTFCRNGRTNRKLDRKLVSVLPSPDLAPGLTGPQGLV